MKKTVCFDFDGVIHSYASGWLGETAIPDPPVPGIADAISEIRDAGFEVVVYSTRCATATGMEAIINYLDGHGIKADRVCAHKPPAIVYIDDRAICFDGNPSTLLDKIKTFKPWNRSANPQK
jgi:phosphoglycolate phosphatase-like HAD superfamily hydrolase